MLPPVGQPQTQTCQLSSLCKQISSHWNLMMGDRQRVALTSGLQGVVGQTRPVLGELAQGILHDHMDVL